MKKNMGSADKVVRILIALLIVVLFAADVISGVLGIVLLVFAGIFMLTSLIGSCPLYGPLGINTSKKKE
jgi:hypothetical protein